MNNLNNLTKNSKIIGIGDDGIKTLDSIIDKIKDTMDIEKISINQDIDKDYVRGLLDGVDILTLTYSSKDLRSKEIVKAIGYMASERRVLSIGLDSSPDEIKDDLGLNRELKISENIELISLVKMMVDSVSDLCMINIDLTDLKELLSTDKSIKYTYGEFDKSSSYDDITKLLFENMKDTGKEFIDKKSIIFVDMDENYIGEDATLIELNELLNKIEKNSKSKAESIFSLYLRKQLDAKLRVGIIYN